MKKKISSIYFSDDWPLTLKDPLSKDWKLGIEIVRKRFEDRYFKPIEILIEHEDPDIRYNVSFLIMSIDCLLIETLNQFYFGLSKTTDKYFNRNNNIFFKYNWQAFRDFFNHSNFFPDFKDNDELTKLFFDEIRCGLLHQAESKTNSLINIKNSKMVVFIDPTNLDAGIILNRTLFHTALKHEFEKYINDLANQDSTNIEGQNLRNMCHSKMMSICSLD